MVSRKKARESHTKEALKDMIPPQDLLSKLTKGERDLDDLLNDSIKKSTGDSNKYLQVI
ncbi:MAG: hypothetical protein HXS46_11765 [Theionarchaea archaeon]|nr:hypothetical protein [Theionarchaea archaeon]